MEVKKNPKVDIEKNKSVFFQLGLVLALALVFLGFNYRQYDEQDTGWDQLVIAPMTDEEIESTRQDEIKPEAPTIVPQTSTTVLQIVTDDAVLNNTLDVNVSDNQNNAVNESATSNGDNDESYSDDGIYTRVEEWAEFPGGTAALIRYMSESVKYPALARESGISGTVIVTFIVEPDGSVTNVKLLRGINGSCDEEALRAVRAMPKWKPGRMHGHPVRQQCNIPVRFAFTN